MKKTILLFLIGILLAGSIFALTMQQTLKVTILAGDLNILSPIPGKIYDQRITPVIILLSQEAKFLKIKDNNGAFRTLCRNCDTHGYFATRLMGFEDGSHNVEFLAIFDDRTVSQTVSFFVDSKKPKILRTQPIGNKFTNGSDFSIEYTEENVKEVLISWNPVVNLTDQCGGSGEKVVCDFGLDLTAFNGQGIEYVVNITDIANHTTSSNPTKVLVDTTVPILTVTAPTEDSVYGRRVPFSLSVSEKVTLEFIDNSEAKPKWENICNRCDSYGLDRLRMRTFDKGNHNVLFRARDKAGNTDEEMISFSVV